MKANKNKILLATLIPASALSAIAIATPALVGCSCGNKKVTLDTEGAPSDLIITSNLVLNKESTITLQEPDGKQLDLSSIVIEVGNHKLEGSDYDVTNVDGKHVITIHADAMTDKNVILKCSYVVVKEYNVNILNVDKISLTLVNYSKTVSNGSNFNIEVTTNEDFSSVNLFLKTKPDEGGPIGKLSYADVKKGTTLAGTIEIDWNNVGSEITTLYLFGLAEKI